MRRALLIGLALDLPGGGAWVEYQALQGGVNAFLAACKTLRPK